MILSSTFNELIYFIKTFLRNKFHQNKWGLILKLSKELVTAIISVLPSDVVFPPPLTPTVITMAGFLMP